MRMFGILLSVVVLCAFPMAAFCGDDDKAPAYRIYIDPETGAYTTEDPLAAAKVVVADASAPAITKSNSIFLPTIIGVLIALLVAGTIRHKRRQLHLR